MANQIKNTSTGKPKNRVDGRLKVTGGAKYFADQQVPGLTYAWIVSSTIAKGTIKKINAQKALAAPGVITVISHLNAPAIAGYQDNVEAKKNNEDKKEELRIFKDNRVYSNGQPIAIVVADTLERAVYAASLVTVEYNKEQSQTDLLSNIDKGVAPDGDADYTRGDAQAVDRAAVIVDETYSSPTEIHNPMELAGIIAMWEGEKLKVFVKTQGVKDHQKSLHETFKIPLENIQVNSEFVGGAFGMSLRVWPHEIAAIVAAKKINRPVKLVIGRDAMFTMVGYRPQAIQKMKLGANADGTLVGIYHESAGITSTYESFNESVSSVSRGMYKCPNVKTKYRMVSLNVGTPIWMRGPGEATGSFALESALDELSYKLNIDPIKLRVINDAETDPESGKPFSSKYLKEAYEIGADKIGWKDRSANPASKKEGDYFVGYGMATGRFGAYRDKATASAKLLASGQLEIRCAAADIGPGTTTAMAQIAADAFKYNEENIKFLLGDSSFPDAPAEGGSFTIATVGSAVYDSCIALQKKLLETAAVSDARFKSISFNDVAFEDGLLSVKADPSIKMSYADVLKNNGLSELVVTQQSVPGDFSKYAMSSFSVHFTKVHVHPLTGVVKIVQIVSVADSGTIINTKTARSQMIGGATGGIGMALTEEGEIDHRYGRHINNNLADYHLPVHADTPAIETYFINKRDPIINPMGAKGMGEIALIGFAASVANAVYNATGKRVRDLPITPDKLI